MAKASRAGGKLAGNTVRLAPVYRGQVDRMFTKESVMARLQEAEPGGCEVVDVRRDEGRIYFTLVRHDTGAILETVASEWVVVVLPEEPGAGLTERDRVVAYLTERAEMARQRSDESPQSATTAGVSLAIETIVQAIRDGRHIP